MYSSDLEDNAFFLCDIRLQNSLTSEAITMYRAQIDPNTYFEL